LVVEAGAWLLREGLSPNTFQKERTEREKREISIEHSWNRRKPVSYTYSHEIIAFFSLIMIPSAAVTVAIPVAIVVLGRPLVPVRSRLLVPSLSPSRRTTSSSPALSLTNPLADSPHLLASLMTPPIRCCILGSSIVDWTVCWTCWVASETTFRKRPHPLEAAWRGSDRRSSIEGRFWEERAKEGLLLEEEEEG
jgi:hypothetical protein